jgi:hypothetical protein
MFSEDAQDGPRLNTRREVTIPLSVAATACRCDEQRPLRRRSQGGVEVPTGGKGEKPKPASAFL